MPADKNGQPLSAGDFVMLPCRIVSVADIELNANLALETVELFYPQPHTRHLDVNTKQVILVTDDERRAEEKIAALEIENELLRRAIEEVQSVLGGGVEASASATHELLPTVESMNDFIQRFRDRFGPKCGADCDCPAGDVTVTVEGVPPADSPPPAPSDGTAAAAEPSPPPIAETATDVDMGPDSATPQGNKRPYKRPAF